MVSLLPTMVEVESGVQQQQVLTHVWEKHYELTATTIQQPLPVDVFYDDKSA